MMENSKVNTQNEKVVNKSTLPPIDRWLDMICPVIKQNDFDTCKGNYRDGRYDTCNGYRQAYNTYLYDFENC